MKSLVIIPAYNEEKSILNTVADIRKNAPDFDYIIINDCSQDKTLQLCKDAGIPVINLPINLGIGGAVQTGYLYAKRTTMIMRCNLTATDSMMQPFYRKCRIICMRMIWIC